MTDVKTSTKFHTMRAEFRAQLMSTLKRKTKKTLFVFILFLLPNKAGELKLTTETSFQACHEA